MTPRLKGILAGGITGGLLSAIPFVNWGNCLCCLWVILGGAIASAVHAVGSDGAVSRTDGTVTGLVSAVPMVAIYVIVGLPLTLLAGPVMLGVMAGLVDDPVMQQQLVEQTGMSTVQAILNLAVSTLVFAFFAAGFGALGGLIGTAIFASEAPGPPVYGAGPPTSPLPPGP